MKHPLARLVASMAMASAPAVLAADAHDHHHEASPTQLELNQGRKWPTDAPLRKAMTALRAEFAAELRAIHKGSLAPGDNGARRRSVETHIGASVSQCWSRRPTSCSTS
jgi:hypothetical protein